MKSYSKITPEGTKDFLFEESDALCKVESKLSAVFKSKGYRKVITPTIEFFDVFNRESAGALPETLYSMTDTYGRLLVLRPDSTLPIARIAATRLKGAILPIRLYYNQRVFSRQPKLTGRNDEKSQSGIELIGASGLRADLEVLTTAVESLDSCGASDYKIEIGHAGFFKALCKMLDVKDDVLAEVYEYLETKNFVALNAVLDTIGKNDITDAIRNLPRMFGGIEIIEKAKKLCNTGEALEALSYLQTIYSSLSALGLKDKIIIDLSLVHRSNYYTGVVFRGYISGSGITVLSGGRYDSLISEFGENLPATGFGVETDALSRAMLDRGDVITKPIPEVLVFGDDGCEITALIYMKNLIKSGTNCENSVAESLSDATKYAKKIGIKAIHKVTKKCVEEIIL
ncbi:MAG: ATP phosphoribosyltransferase regulatory subunit [Oscillospiraceae bacterium]